MSLLATDNTQRLKRAVEISLFTWRRANTSDRLDDPARQGWWGDSFPQVAHDQTGSRLWLLRRRKLTADTTQAAVAYAREALQWLLDGGHAQALQVQVTRAGNDRLNLGVVLTLPGGDRLDLSPHATWQVLYAV